MNVSPAVLGLLRGVGFVALIAVLNFLGDATNLSGVFNTQTDSLIAIVALGIEHMIEGQTGNALFGAVTSH